MLTSNESRKRRRLMVPYEDCTANGPVFHKGIGRHCIFIHKEDGSKTYVQYARYLVSIKLGRKLLDLETVDHVDGDKTNDSIGNLTVLSLSENSSKDGIRRFPDGKSMIEMVCPECKTVFSRRTANSIISRPLLLFNACSNKCRGKLSRRIQLMEPTARQTFLAELRNQVSGAPLSGGTKGPLIVHKHILPSFDEYSKPINDAMSFAKHITKARIEKANPRLCPVCKGSMVGLPKTRITCSDECSRKRLKLADIPLLEDLIIKLAELKSFVQVAKYYGVSDNAVRKWLRKYGRDDLTRKV